MEKKNHPRSESARSNSASRDEEKNVAGGSERQTHENRANPEKDHVPGHMGYTRENLETVNPDTEET